MECLSSMICPSVPDEKIEFLCSIQIETLMDFLMNREKIVKEYRALTILEYEIAAEEIQTFLRPGVATGTTYCCLKPEVIYSSGISSLDKMLNGGLVGGEILELYGRSSSGKTVMCMWLCSKFCQNSEYSVLYIDTKNDLSATRVAEMCPKRTSKILERVRVIKEDNLEDIIEFLQMTSKEHTYQQSSFANNLKLVIIDSLPNIVYPTVSDNMKSWRYCLERLNNELLAIARKQNVIVVLVNHAVNKYQGTFGSGRRNKIIGVKPAMGKYWSQVPNVRLKMSKSGRGQFSIVAEKSTRFPITKNTIKISMDIDTEHRRVTLR